MAKTNNGKRSITGMVHLKPAELALLSITLIVASGLLTGVLLKKATPALAPAVGYSNVKLAGESPAWGELRTRDIVLEESGEYCGFELKDMRPTQWVFAGLNRDQTRSQLLTSGLTAGQTDRVLADATSSSTSTILHPDGELLLGLTPAIRSKLYTALAKNPANHYMEHPFCYPGKTFEEWFGDGAKDDHLTAVVRKLLYPRGDGLCFSDFEFVMQQGRSDEERLQVVKDLSRQAAVLAGIHIRPDTDIDKLLGYWQRGFQVKDVRPLIESTARLRDGADMSLLYFLPKFARERLYTFPVPTKAGDPITDCHWSTMNFFNDPPDNRFTDTTYTVSYIQSNLYQVAMPTMYGDVILILNDKDSAIHSAVYIADEIVFTKNGNNFAQPWMLMRLKDLLFRYTTDAPPKMVVYRDRNA